MRFVRLKRSDGVTGWGRLYDEIIELLDRAPWEKDPLPIGNVPFDKQMLLAPAVPRKVVALAANYEGATGRHEEDEEPIVFIKPGSSVIGPNDEILCPFKEVKVWGESELAIVVGRTLTNASLDQARAAIFGYTLANDVTAENVSGRDHHLARSKAADTFCPIGPWIATDFIPDKQLIQGWHNQVLLRESTLNQRVVKEVETLVWLSKWLTLEPGDIVLTGAPNRVRDRIFFKDGDTFTCRLEGLGELKNCFRQFDQL
jgi:2-keto-4-pentenoate hydratase/2-oxohepta-3-ene-1,7-dioic acid hydratase in catechol pathway